jgi:hypothetical protein
LNISIEDAYYAFDHMYAMHVATLIFNFTIGGRVQKHKGRKGQEQLMPSSLVGAP